MGENDQIAAVFPKVTLGWRVKVRARRGDGSCSYVAHPSGGNAFEPHRAFVWTRKSYAKHAAVLWRRGWFVTLVRVTSRRRPRK